MASRKSKGRTVTKRRANRATSNVFALFNSEQIQEFKEAFNLLDQNRDGFIDKNDLHDILSSLGKNAKDDYLDDMIKEAPGPINFTMFLTLFGEKLQGTDPEEVVRNAFACFDQELTGYVPKTKLKELLSTMGDRLSEDDVEEVIRDVPIIRSGMFNYLEFIRILKHGSKNPWNCDDDVGDDGV